MTTVGTYVPVVGNADSRERQERLAERKVVLRIQDLRKAFGGQVVLGGVSGELREGEVVLLRGDNGSGKTTLLNILSGNLEPDAGSIHFQVNGTTEHFSFPRRWWGNLNPFDHFTPERVAREGVGRTWQDVRLFSTLTLTENIAVASPGQSGENPIKVLARSGTTLRRERENRQSAVNRLAGLGLNGRENSSADQISLGQTKRVAIARAVQAGARVLFLDEPLAGLDAKGIGDVLELLRQLVQEHRVTLVVVEHVFNIPRILDLADTVWTLQNGRINVESPSAVGDQCIGTSGSDTIKWLAKQLGHAATVSKEPLLGDAILWRLRTPTSETWNGEPPALEVQDVVVCRGNRLVIGWEESDGGVQGLSFSIKRGEVAVLQAPNGWGKTTLAEAITGIIPTVRCRVRLDGEDIGSSSVWEKARAGLRFVPARNNVFPQLTVGETLRLTHKRSIPQPIRSLEKCAAAQLSGGEKQKLALASIPGNPRTVIYDEPFSALDPSALSGWVGDHVMALRCAILILLPMSTRDSEV